MQWGGCRLDRVADAGGITKPTACGTTHNASEGTPVHQITATAGIDAPDMARAQQLVGSIVRSFENKVVGQTRLRETLVIGLLTGGHVLLESVPGLAKTTAAQAIAESVSADFRRIQCTPDLQPTDVTGLSIFNFISPEWRSIALDYTRTGREDPEEGIPEGCCRVAAAATVCGCFAGRLGAHVAAQGL